MRPLPATILIVEDEPVIASAMQAILQEAGAQVLVASCMEEALTCCSRNKPKIALLNAKLPDTDGIMLADMLHRCFGIAPLFVTGARRQDVSVPPGNEPKWPVLHKPFTVSQLLHFVAGPASRASGGHRIP